MNSENDKSRNTLKEIIGFSPSDLQIDVLKEVYSLDKNLIIEAVAGGGKTSTIKAIAMMLCHYQRVSQEDIIFLAFNSKIVKEIKQKLVLSGLDCVDVKTVHSYGYSLLANSILRKASNGKFVVSSYKYTNFIKRLIQGRRNKKGELYEEGLYHDWERQGLDIPDASDCTNFVSKLCNFVRLTLTDENDVSAIYEMNAHFRVVPSGELLRLTIPLIPQILAWGKNLAITMNEIDFNDMVWLPWTLKDKIRDASIQQYRLVLGDECQDWSSAQRYVVSKALATGGTAVFVGDKFQCQPPGTLVTIEESRDLCQKVKRKLVPIENVKKGDIVTSVNNHFNPSPQVVLDTASRYFEGDLMVVISENGTVSRYTPNHKCLVKFCELKNKKCVYLMRRGNQYRVGCTDANIPTSDGGSKGSGLMSRLRSEGADALWILKWCETKQEAWMIERLVAADYRIPQLMFDARKSFCKWPEWFDTFWEELGDNSADGERCLKDYGLFPEYPLMVKSSDSSATHQSMKRPILTYACNLVPGILVMEPDFSKPLRCLGRKEWISADVIRQAYKGLVYSLSVSGRELYFADGILTHNSIQGFCGGDNDSFNKVKNTFDCKVMPLSVCYRCPPEHVSMAKLFVEGIEAADLNKIGKTEFIPESQLVSYAKLGDLMICRKTSYLVRTAINLISKKIPALILGRDIASSLCSTIERIFEESSIPNVQFYDFPEALREWKDKRLRRYIEVGNCEDQIERLTDEIESLRAIYEAYDATSVSELIAEIKNLFTSDEEGNALVVTLSTIHKMKGGEAERVFFLRPDYCPMKWRSQQPWEYQQELNLMYIALTRSTHSLFFVLEGDEKK